MVEIRDSTNVIKRRHELQQRIQALESEISSFHLKQSLMFDSGHTGNSFFSHSGALVMEPWQASGPMMKMPPATRPPPPASFIHDMNTVGFPNLSETFDIPFTSDLTDGSSSRKRPSSAASNTSANKRTKLLNDNKTPCLRCKILKKKVYSFYPFRVQQLTLPSVIPRILVLIVLNKVLTTRTITGKFSVVSGVSYEIWQTCFVLVSDNFSFPVKRTALI